MRDLTKGNPTKLILMFAIPLLIGNVFQQLYNIIDVRIVGTTLGNNALAAVGSTSSINSLVIGFVNGLTNGFAIIVARNFGANDYEKMRKSVAGTLTLGLLTSIILTIISVTALMPFLRFLNTPDEIIKDAYAFIKIILLGMTAAMLYNVCSGVLRAIGDTVTPLLFLIVSALVNIVLDFTFILAFKMGVEGAAYATVISQILSFVLCFIYILKKYPFLRLHKEDFKLNRYLISELYGTGISMGFMLSLVSIGTLALQSSINTFGTQIIVAHTAARKLSEMFMLPISVFGAAAATFSSQNLGANRIDRIKIAINKNIMLIWIWSTIVIIATFTMAPLLIQLITGTKDTDIIKTATSYLRFNTPFYYVLCVLIVIRNAMQGIGDRITPVLSSIIELAGKVAVVVYLAPKLGYFGIIISEPIVWILCSLLLGFKIRKNEVLMSKN